MGQNVNQNVSRDSSVNKQKVMEVEDEIKINQTSLSKEK